MQSGDNTENFFGRWWCEEVWSQLWLSTQKKQLEICIKYAYISEFMLRQHEGKFVNVKLVKIPSLAPLQVAKYIKTVK